MTSFLLYSLELCSSFPKGIFLHLRVRNKILSFRQKYVTIVFNEVKDFSKICAKLRLEFNGERIDGSLRQDDFHRLQTRVIDNWCNSSSYKVLEPVRFIGPQVS